MASKELEAVTSGNNAFANKIYDSIVKDVGDKNLIVSPFSVHAVLAMLHQGAAGKTADALSSVLSIGDASVGAKGYKELIKALNSVKGVNLNIANKVFIGEKFPVEKKFQKVTKESFQSESQSLNFKESGKSVAVINGWVEDKTNKRIKNLLQPNQVDEFTSMVLVNAIYFKGKWEHQFRPAATRTDPFYIKPDEEIKVDMMHRTGQYPYAESAELDAKILELRYEKNEVSMIVILPNKIDGLAELEEKLKTTDLKTITQSLRSEEVIVSLPKFKIESTIPLNDHLKKLGLEIIYSEKEADFSGISRTRTYVSDAVQKAFIEVNEEGAEAAAATAHVIQKRSLVISEKEDLYFVADRPFAFRLIWTNSKAAFFAGRVTRADEVARRDEL